MAQLSNNPDKVAGLWIPHFYQRYERPISSISLLGGFAFDSVTLTRADQFREALWIVVHLLAVAVCIVLINRQQPAPAGDGKSARRKHFWLANAVQFLFGGLLSTYIVFYFRSATLTVTWPFMLILVAAFLANDRLKEQHERLAFQVGLFFLSIFAFAMFMLPVLLHRIGPAVFLASGALSLVLIWGFVAALENYSRDRIQADRISLAASIAAIFIALNAMYFLNVIPPLPLSLKDGEIVHSVTRTAAGEYIVRCESRNALFGYFNVFDDFHEAPGDSVSAWSAVFSPPGLNLTIVHEWQFYNEETRRWTTESRITLKVIGGRDGGFRTYSTKSHAAPGLWRVNIKTEEGAVIGRIRFRVVPVSAPVPLRAEDKT
jgi:hypothetical protein